MSNHYTLTRKSLDRINRVCDAVESSAKERTWYDPRPSSPYPKRIPKLQIGKTTAAWSKGSTADIPVHSKTDQQPTGATAAGVINLFADVEAGKWVAFMDGILIAAEC